VSNSVFIGRGMVWREGGASMGWVGRKRNAENGGGVLYTVNCYATIEGNDKGYRRIQAEEEC